jgi:DNA invertase Pin-like site-specific DNA recombinase
VLVTTQEGVEAKLARLKDGRRRLEADLDKLDRELAEAISRARALRMPMDEIARRAGTTRATLYRCLARTEGSK